MKKTFFAAMMLLIAMTVSATNWTETCGTEVTQEGTFWPYSNAFQGYDHYGECTYDGWNTTVRYLARYADYGPHIYMAKSKDCRFSIDGIPGGENATLSFDIVCYSSSQTAGTYENLNLIGLKVNESSVELESKQISSSAFTTVSVAVSLPNASNKIEWTKASSVEPEVRLDNFKVTYGPVVQQYTLTISAGVGGTVNSSVNGTYDEGTTVTITATPNTDYSFVQWSDGNQNASRDVTMNSDITLKAEFKPNFYNVSDLLKIYNDLNLAVGGKSEASYTARGYVTYWKSGYPTNQNGDFYVDDYADGSTSRLECFRLKGKETSDQRKLEKGEYVEFTGKLQNYNGRAEVFDGTFHVLSETPQTGDESDCLTEFEGMKGPQILAALHDKIKDPDTVSYYYLRADKTGIDYRADGTVWDMYSPCSFNRSDYCATVEYTEYCQCYNREHMVPQSWWANDNSQRMRTDLHNVIPADALTNEQRSNNPYGEVTGTPSWSNEAGSKLGSGTYNTTVFEPSDEYKGDIARVYFYMVTCYNDKNFTQHWKGRKVFTFTNDQAGLTPDAQSLFLRWHRNDPVSDKERNRNNGIEKKQHNRNPFVDAPELVEYIWGTKSGKTYQCTATAIENTEAAAPRATKRIENGVLVLEMPDGTKYNATGLRIR